jgi:hypothetical protein
MQALQAIDSGETVNTLAIVREIREDRMAMVQHLEQYEFAYSVILKYAAREVATRTASGVFTTIPAGSPLLEAHRQDPQWKHVQATETHHIFTLDVSSRDTMPRQQSEASVAAFEAREDEEAVLSPSPELRRKMMSLPLEQQPWFRTGLSRQQVDELLHDAPEGMFVVRESTQASCYALSVVHSGAIAHMLIVPHINGTIRTYQLGRLGDEQFPSVAELVRYYQTNNYARNDVTGKGFRLMNVDMSRRVSQQSFV